MALDDFDQLDPAETYPRRSAKRRRRTIRIRFTGPIALISLGLFIATLLIGGVAGSWMTGTVNAATIRDDFVVISCMVAAMSYFTGREWLSERKRERGEADRLATVMVWHADRAEENKEILDQLRTLTARFVAALDEVREEHRTAIDGLASRLRNLNAAVDEWAKFADLQGKALTVIHDDLDEVRKLVTESCAGVAVRLDAAEAGGNEMLSCFDDLATRMEALEAARPSIVRQMPRSRGPQL